jgi:hypothetical protein
MSCLLDQTFTSCSKKSTFDAAMLTGKSLEQYDVMAKIGAFESCPMILIKDVRIDSNVLFFTIEYEGACDKEEVFDCVGLERLMIKFILLFGKLNFSSSLSLILAKRLNTELW